MRPPDDHLIIARVEHDWIGYPYFEAYPVPGKNGAQLFATSAIYRSAWNGSTGSCADPRRSGANCLGPNHRLTATNPTGVQGLGQQYIVLRYTMGATPRFQTGGANRTKCKNEATKLFGISSLPCKSRAVRYPGWWTRNSCCAALLHCSRHGPRCKTSGLPVIRK